MTRTESDQVSPVRRTTLPVAAQRWLNRALPQDPELPSSIRMEQEGTMDLNGRWTPFTASGVYKAPPLSFNWQARFHVLPGVWIVAEDGHLNVQGWGGARLWGVIPMGKRTEPEVLLTQLVRNLAELAWLPQFALVDSTLRWGDAGESAFEVKTDAGGRELMVRFEIDHQGDIIQASSPWRPYDVPGGYAEAPWHYEFSEHRDFRGVRLPAVGVASFEEADGPVECFRGQITSIDPGVA